MLATTNELPLATREMSAPTEGSNRRLAQALGGIDWHLAELHSAWNVGRERYRLGQQHLHGSASTRDLGGRLVWGGGTSTEMTSDTLPVAGIEPLWPASTAPGDPSMSKAVLTDASQGMPAVITFTLIANRTVSLRQPHPFQLQTAQRIHRGDRPAQRFGTRPSQASEVGADGATQGGGIGGIGPIRGARWRWGGGGGAGQPEAERHQHGPTHFWY